MKELENKDAILFILAVLGLFFYLGTVLETGLMGLIGTIVFVWSGYILFSFWNKYRKWLD